MEKEIVVRFNQVDEHGKKVDTMEYSFTQNGNRTVVTTYIPLDENSTNTHRTTLTVVTFLKLVVNTSLSDKIKLKAYNLPEELAKEFSKERDDSIENGYSDKLHSLYMFDVIESFEQ